MACDGVALDACGSEDAIGVGLFEFEMHCALYDVRRKTQ